MLFLPQPHSTETEALIVGGGPAGLAAAIALCQRGIDCTVVEARPPGIDKACGERLMPDSQAVLAIVARLPHALEALMLTLDRWPRFKAHAIRALADAPEFFHGLLDVHVGKRPLSSVLLRHGAGFARRLLAGAAPGRLLPQFVSDMSAM